MEIFLANFLETKRLFLMNSGDLGQFMNKKISYLKRKILMEIFLTNFLETKILSLMNSGNLYKMLHCKDHHSPLQLILLIRPQRKWAPPYVICWCILRKCGAAIEECPASLTSTVQYTCM